MPDRDPDSSPLSPTNVLTPGATAIAAFAFAVFSMLGQGTWSTALTTLFWGANYGSPDTVMVVWGVGCLLMAGLGIGLARRSMQTAGLRWEGHLARAAVIVAVVGAALAVLEILGGLVHGA